MSLGRFDFSHRALRLFALVALVGTGFALLARGEQGRQIAAVYSRGSLSVTIHYHSQDEGRGRLVAEVLDPEGKTLGRMRRDGEIAKRDGVWHGKITPEKPIAFDDMLWQRIRYRFDFNHGKVPAIVGVEEISRVLRRPVVRVLGEKDYMAGSRAAIRVIVADADSGSPLSGRALIELVVPNGQAIALYSGTLNRRGTLAATFNLPAGITGKCEMRFVVDTPIGSTKYTQPVELEDSASVLLTTEKPIYQPGQTIHVRALALDRASHRADAGRKLMFEVEDSHGNKVFRKATETDKYGIASAEFTLADEVNLGAYHLRALMGDPQAPSNTAEVTLQVERYMLPKFKVAIEFTQLGDKPRHDYRPGDHVTGTVRANYFFGRPVDHADVSIKISGMDVAMFEAAKAAGKTDGDGAFHFDLKLPAYFAGRPLSQGAARALVETTVKDFVAHEEKRGEPITISESPLLITAIPEGGSLVPNIENQVFILTAYPNGSPAPATLKVDAPRSHGMAVKGARDDGIATDSSGVELYRINPGAGIDSLHVEADDHHGNRVTITVPLAMRGGTEQILLRTDRAVIKIGDSIHLKVFSTRARGTAYVDLVNNGQTILARDIDVENGEAELTVSATPEMAGTLDIDAYLFGRDSEPVADHRLMFVEPADELHVAATSNAAVYQPGGEAHVQFHVTNARGEGVQAALGLQVVDEAVFALAEKQPGFAKVFFYLEQELMKPHYEIHSLSMDSVVEPGNAEGKEGRDLPARALFAATELANPAKLDLEFGRSLPQQKFAEYQERYRVAFEDQVRQIAEKLSREIAGKPVNIVNAFQSVDNGARPVDAWNTALRIVPTGWNWSGKRYFLVHSAGPDLQFDTSDDLAVYIEVRSGSVVAPPNTFGRGGALEVKMEHDRGPMNGRAEISGRVEDQTGAIIPDATITLRRIPRENRREAQSNAEGRFTFAGLPVGRYGITVSARGFNSVSHEVNVQPRDRAEVSATLAVGASTEAVMVEAEAVNAPEPMAMMAGAGVLGRIGVATGMNRLQFADAKAENRLLAGNAVLKGRSFAAVPPAQAAAPHVRSYFPEALYIDPEIITDGKGDASISIPIADSITTWRMAMMASTADGALGSGASSLKVFQDFFVDLDLPVTLTQGDRVAIPVAIYNYSGERGEVALTLKQEVWFALDNDVAEKQIAVDSGHVGSAQFAISANHIGKFKLTLSAHLAGAQGRDDIVVREIEVIPSGRERNLVFNGRLEGRAEHELKFPADAIPDASSVLVRLYPGPLSQVIEGMESILSMPGGCFEQTSSSTYPNVLALDYMKRTKKLTPEIHARAEGYIATGYQRLLTFEVPGGGFSWFGQAPANKILTAYGLMEFSDMAKVSDVDPRLIERTSQWLESLQEADGSWKQDTYFISEGATNRYTTDRVRITAYIAWSLANVGYRDDTLEKAKQYIESAGSDATDAYTLAVIASFAVDYGKDREFTRRAMDALIKARNENGDQVSWTTGETSVYSTGPSASIETTGLASQALLKWGQASEIVRKALNFISARRDASGNWGTTQATIMALRALLLATEMSASDVRGTIAVLLDGKVAKTLELTAENNDLLHQFVFKGIDARKANVVQLKFDGSGGLAYQVVGRYFTPWEKIKGAEALAIDVSYDRTRLAENDIVTATAKVRNNLPKFANMVMVDLGIPPGFDLLSEDLQTMQEKTEKDRSGRLERFSMSATQAILYFNSLAPRQTVTVQFRLRAKYPIHARTLQSRVYEYYDPAVSAIAQPIQLEVTKR